VQTVLRALRDHAAHRPDHEAFHVGVGLASGGSWHMLTYAELERRTLDWARLFVARQLREQSVVFFVLRHGAEMYPAYLGAMRAGLVPCFLAYPTPKQDPDLYWRDHAALFERAAPGAVVTYGDNVAPVTRLLAGRDCCVLDIEAVQLDIPDVVLPPLEMLDLADRPALLQHSSGTTGLKKGVSLTFGQLLGQLHSYAARIHATGADRIISWLPLYHDMGLITSFLLPVTLGATCVSLDAFDWLARPPLLFELIGQHRITLSWLPNFAFRHMIRARDSAARFDLSSVRAFINCSEPCKADTVTEFLAAFADDGVHPEAMQNCFAMAEAVFAVAQTEFGGRPREMRVEGGLLARHGRAVAARAASPDVVRFLSCGRPIWGIRVRVAADPALTEPGSDAPQGVPVGEIEISGDFVFSGYYRNAEATAAAFREGWYRTGDVGFLHDGELFICGRQKDMLIIHGRNYYAHDIEEIVNTVAGVKPGRVVSFGVFDTGSASEAAVVVAETGLEGEDTRSDLRRRIRRAIAERLDLQAKNVELLAPGALIKTTSGKINRIENMRRFSAARVRESV